MKKNDPYVAAMRLKAGLYVRFALGFFITSAIAAPMMTYGSAGSSLEVGALRPDELISGSVQDVHGPMPGVSVSIKERPQIGTATDADGKFNLRAKQGEHIIFKMIGYMDRTIIVGKVNHVEIRMEEDAGQLEEVVVVGYGTQKKATLTGAVASISSKDMESRPATNISSAMQGTMAGVTINRNSGQPGANGGQIRIRGVGTLGDSNPLVVIDGVPGGDMNMLNPDDVESISVLKDAASSSIYGVRGANGVIVVTTKKGKQNTGAQLSYSSYFGMQTPTALPKFLGSTEYMQMANEARVNANQNPTYTDAQIATAAAGTDPNGFANTDWISEIYKKSAPQQNHSLSLSGGGENMSYFASYGFLNEGGLITGNAFGSKRHNARLRLNTKLLKVLDLDANLGYIDRLYTTSTAEFDDGSGPIKGANQTSPLVPVRFTTGGWGYHGGSSNPVATATDGGQTSYSTQEMQANLQATLNISDQIRLRGQYALSKANSLRNAMAKTITYLNPQTGAILHQTNLPNSVVNVDSTALNQSFLAMAEYENKFKENTHYLKVMLAASQEETIINGFQAKRNNLPGEGTPNLNIGTTDQTNSGWGDQSALQSFFGRANYAYKDKYLAEANFRYDGSSRFGPDHRWDLFSSGSLGWVFSEESFFKVLRQYVELGKVRLSYGTQGNDKVVDKDGNPINYGYLMRVGPTYVDATSSTMPIGNKPTTGYRQQGLPNYALTWESVSKQNIGLDLRTLKGRLGITADYFVNRTNDILINVPVPDQIGLGLDYTPQNAGQVENRGWELQLNWQDQIQEVRYGATFNIADVKNQVLSLGNTTPNFADQIRQVGQPIDAFYGLVAERIAQVSDFTLKDGKYTPNFPYDSSNPMQPGDLMYKDLNGDGKITLDGDRQVIGNAIPRYTYGFRGDLGWKAFDFSFFLQGVGKVDGYIDGSSRHAFVSESSNPQEIHRDRWTPENTGAANPRLVYDQDYNQRMSTYWLEDASYIRLKNIQLGYTLPGKLLEKARISRMRVYASADNVFTKTNFFYAYDPESPVGNKGFYPQVKTFVFGLNVNFK